MFIDMLYKAIGNLNDNTFFSCVYNIYIDIYTFFFSSLI